MLYVRVGRLETAEAISLEEGRDAESVRGSGCVNVLLGYRRKKKQWILVGRAYKNNPKNKRTPIQIQKN